MKTEYRIFGALTVFFVLCAVAYAALTGLYQGVDMHMESTGVEMAGTAAFVLSALLTGLTGSYLWFVSRRLDDRPEDYEEAEIADGAGELGFFAPRSIWPILCAASAALTVIGMAFYEFGIIAVGAVFVILTAIGFVFEYHFGPEKH